METNLQPRVIFLYSLPKSVVEPMQLKGVDYNSVIKMIGDFDGVEVHDLNRDFFSMSHKCNILIVLGEFLEDKNALLLQDDSTFPLADLTPLIGSSFREVNVIDCAWCYSGKGKTHDELKEYTNALVNTINSYTSAETRLALYWLLLKDTTLLGRDNYKDCYDKILGDLDAYQNGMDPKQLESLSEGTNLGTNETVTMPYEMVREKKYPFTVYIHENDYESVKKNSEWENAETEIRWDISISNLMKDEKYEVTLSFDSDNIIGAGSQFFKWSGYTVILTFEVWVADSFVGDEFWSYISIKQDDKPIDENCKRRITVVSAKARTDDLESKRKQSPQISSQNSYSTISGEEINYKEIYEYFLKTGKVREISYDDFVYSLSHADLKEKVTEGKIEQTALYFLIGRLTGRVQYRDLINYSSGRLEFGDETIIMSSTWKEKVITPEWKDALYNNLKINSNRTIVDHKPDKSFVFNFMKIPLVRPKKLLNEVK